METITRTPHSSILRYSSEWEYKMKISVGEFPKAYAGVAQSTNKLAMTQKTTVLFLAEE
jgi:hypothetical protein